MMMAHQRTMEAATNNLLAALDGSNKQDQYQWLIVSSVFDF
jgi:hypothetical protein